MKLEDKDVYKTFTRRAFVLGAIQIGILASLGGRLGWLQIVEGERYRTLSDKNRINVKILEPARGVIVDRDGAALAENNQSFRAVVIPEQTKDLEQSLRSLQKIIDLADPAIAKILKTAKKSPSFAPLEVKDNLSWDEVAAVEVHLPDLPGLSIGAGQVRSYPYGESAAHIIGYVGAVNEAEMTEDPLFSLPGFKIGKSGIEKTYDEAMRGRAGAAEVEVNVVGREVREMSREPPTMGSKITLSLDAELQKFTQETLAAEQSAAAVVMDIHTGAVYALASYPAFDPNVFTRGIPEPVWIELSENPAKPLTNKAVSGQYPPGSTFKMVTALAGLRSGKISRARTSFCPGHFDLGETRFHCWKAGGHGTVNLESALAGSCDVYFYEAARDVGIDAIAQAARDLGLGSKLDFDLSEERPGLIPDRVWKKEKRGESWQLGETIVTGIGQGFTLTTPLQLATMTARLCNGGFAVKPWLVAREGERMIAPGAWPRVNNAAEHLDLILSGMNRVTNDPSGTAYDARIKDAGFEMAGKTGTAQVRRITKQMRAEGVKNETLPWEQRHHALFVGYAPLLKPQYACCVIVEHGVGGAKAAAPMARDILLETQRRAPARRPVVANVKPGT